MLNGIYSNPRYWTSPDLIRQNLNSLPKPGHPPEGTHVPVRTNWEDRQPRETLDYSEALLRKSMEQQVIAQMVATLTDLKGLTMQQG